MVKWFKKLYASQSLPSTPTPTSPVDDHLPQISPLPQPHTRDAIPERARFFNPVDTDVKHGAETEDGDADVGEEEDEEEEEENGPKTAPPMIIRSTDGAQSEQEEDDVLYSPPSIIKQRGRRSRKASSKTMHAPLDKVAEDRTFDITSEGEAKPRRVRHATGYVETEEEEGGMGEEDDAAYESAPAFFLPIKRYLSENEASRARQWQDKVSQRVVKSKTSGIMNTLLAGAKPLSQNTWRDPADWQAALAQSEGTSKAWKTLVRKGIPTSIRPIVSLHSLSFGRQSVC